MISALLYIAICAMWYWLGYRICKKQHKGCVKRDGKSGKYVGRIHG